MYVYAEHRTSVNTVQFAPAEFGLVLACGSTDGDVSILTGDPKVIKGLFCLLTKKLELEQLGECKIQRPQGWCQRRQLGPSRLNG